MFGIIINIACDINRYYNRSCLPKIIDDSYDIIKNRSC